LKTKRYLLELHQYMWVSSIQLIIKIASVCLFSSTVLLFLWVHLRWAFIFLVHGRSPYFQVLHFNSVYVKSILKAAPGIRLGDFSSFTLIVITQITLKLNWTHTQTCN